MDFLGAFAVLDPKGAIALSERTLMLYAVEFMLIVALPVLFLTFFFAWRYRASNTKAAYVPNWAHSKMEELIWWAIPLEIVLILGALTWSSTHELDPRVPLGTEEPLVVQVVALEWKWLFIYPSQGVAAVNEVAMPVGQPVRFDVTADAPMNSFWIPQLGGQIYAMTGMTNSLNLIADYPGTYAGSSANYSGEGFAKMRFVAHALQREQFDAWVTKRRSAPGVLNESEYDKLLTPSTSGALYYARIEDGLYQSILQKFTDSSAPSTH